MIDFNKYTNKEINTWLLRFILFFNFTLIPYLNINSQEIDEYLSKSMFILKAPVFIEWPDNSSFLKPQINFEIAIIGTDPFNGKLESIIKSKNIKIKSKNVTVRVITKVADIKEADILFISNSEKYNLNKIMSSIKGKPILTVSETKDYIDKGVMINMYVENNKLDFNINLKSSNESKIYISSKLLANANIVIK